MNYNTIILHEWLHIMANLYVNHFRTQRAIIEIIIESEFSFIY